LIEKQSAGARIRRRNSPERAREVRTRETYNLVLVKKSRFRNSVGIGNVTITAFIQTFPLFRFIKHQEHIPPLLVRHVVSIPGDIIPSSLLSLFFSLFTWFPHFQK
jgi:hypothetical protein